MDKVNWIKFIEVFERSHVDLVESYFKANGIETQMVQEAYYEYQIGGAAFGRIEILVPNNQIKKAGRLYAQSGWDFDTTEIKEEKFTHRSQLWKN